MNQHGRKMVAPLIISVLFVLYFIFIAVFVFTAPGIPWYVKLLSVIVPLALAGVMIGVLVSRIKEIRSGVEDDLSKY